MSDLAYMNRRQETRYRTISGLRIAWSPDSAARRRRKGWVLDVSPHGMGFMAEQPYLPKVGETISVKVRPNAEAASYEVIRLRPTIGHLAIIGCRRNPGSTADLELPPTAWQMQAAA